MSPPISSTVKERVIQLDLEGKGRNEIAEILNSSHIRISQGSVTNILRTHKANTDEASTTGGFLKASESSGSPSQLQTSSTSINEETQIPVSKGPEGQEPLSVEDAEGPEELRGLEVPIATASSTSILTSSPPSLGPEALRLVGVNSYPYLFSLGYLNPQISQVNMGLVNPICQDSEKEKEITHEEAQEVHDSSPGPVAPEVTSSEVHTKEPSSCPEPGELPWSEIFQQIEDAKRQRHEELLLIDRRSAQLEEQKRRIDYERGSIEQARYELDTREVRLLEVEPLIPVARQLRDLGTDINHFLAWVETIKEVDQIEKIDSRTAAYRIAQELRSYRQLGSLQKSIEQAQQRLAILNMFTAQKERALTILMELHKRGVSLDEIYGFSKILDLDKLGKQWHYGMRIGKTDNTNMNGGGRASEFKLDDKLNCVV